MNAIQTMEAVSTTAKTLRAASDVYATMDSRSTMIREPAQVRKKHKYTLVYISFEGAPTNTMADRFGTCVFMRGWMSRLRIKHR